MKRRVISLSLLAFALILLISSRYLLAANNPPGPTLTLPHVSADSATQVTLPVTYASDGHSISTLVFSIDFDETLLTFDDSDNNSDGIPDAIVFNLPAMFAPSAVFDASDSDGELDFTIFDFAPPLATLPDGELLTITFTTAAGDGVANVNFAADPAPSFGSTTGQSIPGVAENGSVTVGGTATATSTATGTATSTPTSTATPTGSATATATSSATATPTGSVTATPTGSVTATPTGSATPSATPTQTPTPPATSDGRLFIPIIRVESPSAIYGRITDGQGQGVSGVTIRTQAGTTAVSDSQGYYTLAAPQPGSYTILPSLGSTSFSPAIRNVVVPPNGRFQDFVAIAPPTATPNPTNTPRPNPTNTPRPNPTNTPSPSCWNGIVNGGFENNDGWTIGDNEYRATYTNANAHSGSRSMQVGIINSGDNRFAYSSFWQYVTIPSDASDATLRFWLDGNSSGTRSNDEQPTPPSHIPTSATERSLNDDAQYVLLYDAQGNQHTLLFQRSDSGWRQHQFNLGSFAGQQVRLYFGVFNNGSGGVTGMFVDDVELVSCR